MLTIFLVLLVPILLGFLVAVLNGPFWIPAALISIFYLFVGLVIAFLFDWLGTGLSEAVLFFGGAFIFIGVFVGWLVTMVLGYIGFFIGFRVRAK